MKSLEENQKLVFIPPKDRLDLRGFLRICHKYLRRDNRGQSQDTLRNDANMAHLKHMKCLELNVLALITKKVHHHFQVSFVGDVASHNVEICPIKEDLAQELKRLSFRDIIIGEDKGCKRGKELVGR